MTVTPTTGRIVNYVPSDKQKAEWGNVDVVPAIITRVFNTSIVNLQVFTDSPKGIIWETSVEFDGKNASRSWHWPIIKPIEEKK